MGYSTHTQRDRYQQRLHEKIEKLERRLEIAQFEISQRDDVIEKLRRRLEVPRAPEVVPAQWSREVDHTGGA